jgi:lipoprotein-anchoring transpeptidase ErfK/SrfK
LTATAVFGGCVASDSGSGFASDVVSKRVERNARVQFSQAATSTTVALTATTSPAAPRTASASRARVSKPASGATQVARTSPQPGTPWPRYNGQLTGGSYTVARALGPALDVSLAPDTAPSASLSNPLASGAPRVVVVVQDAGDWLQVLLPMRPNSSVGWIRRSDVEVSRVYFRVEIDRAAHRLRVFDGNESIVADEPVAVGKSSTPTPSGQFFTVELLQPTNPSGAYGPYAFTLSAYSEVYQTFGSGDGAVGMHGTNESSSIGQDASHGCIRLNNAAIQNLAGMLPLGTPVFIR